MRLQLQGTLLLSMLRSPSGRFLVPGIVRIESENLGNLFSLKENAGEATFLYSGTASASVASCYRDIETTS